jgi:hypothetical protein
MKKEEFLTARWNNVLTLGLGLVFVIYAVVVWSTSVLSDSAAFVGLVVIGAVYLIAVEQHLNMRFAWLRENSANTVSVEQSFTSRLIFVVYNVARWIPVVLAVVGTIDYGTAFLAFFVYTLIRAIANLYRNNVLTPEQAESFPLRSP